MNQLTWFDVLQDPVYGIFSALEDYNIPWNNNLTAQPTDIEYNLNHSANKIISRLVSNLLNAEYKLTTDKMSQLALIIYNKYIGKWTKIYATYGLEYNPIQNYDMTEQVINDITQTEYGHTTERVDDYATTKTGTDTNAVNTSENNSSQQADTVTNEKQGFNSTDYVGNDRDTRAVSASDTRALASTNTTTYDTGGTQNGTQTLTEGGTDTHTRNSTLTRSGNIGVTTSQQMIKSEMELWAYKFVEMVYNDIDTLLTIPYYSYEGVD